MPSIYLKETGDYYFSGFIKVDVSQENYEPSKLFKKYKHDFELKITGKIWIYNEKFSSRINLLKFWHFFGNCLAITPGTTHKDAKLKEAHVYVNKHDPDKTPLVFVLIFNNGDESTVENKYYTRSKFNGKFTGGQSVNISGLHQYNGDDNSILKDLLKENDSLKELLTYDIGKREGDSPPDNGNGRDKYNNKKITVQEDSRGEPNLSGNGFTRYKHEPANGNGNDDKKACVIFDGNVLMQKDSTNEVKGIQGAEYKEITVYMGEKAKKTSAIPKKGEIEVPLLIELNKQGSRDGPDYYVHKRNKSLVGKEYYWEQLPGSGGNTLKDLLVDMGFGMKTGEPGHEKLKKILESSGVNGVGEGDDLSSKLGEVKGKQLQAMLKERVGEGGDESQKLFLELLLTRIEFDLLDSVIVLLEKRDSDGSTYDEGQVSTVVKQLDPNREINRVSMNGGTKKIDVKDVTGNKGQCVQKYKYKVYEHDLTQVVNGLGGHGKSAIAIRFIMPSETNGPSGGQYKQLKLYDNKTEPRNLEYKYYGKNGRSGDGTSNKTTVYVWFYNGDDNSGKGDPRPLLLSYNKTIYAPKDKEKYFTEWAKVELTNGQSLTNECGCSQGPETVQVEDNKLLHELDKVVKFLNTVDLKKGTSESNGNGPHKYNVHKFQNKDIQIKVTCSTVDGISSGPPSPSGTCKTSPSTSCYKMFKHKPIGMNGGSNGTGYRLGEVVYNGSSSNRTGTLNYIKDSSYKYHPLVCVTVYYYDKDSKYDDPLLVELEFKKNGGDGAGDTGPKEYYKLKPNGNGGDGARTWQKDEDANGKMGTQLVEHLDKIRHSLKKHIKILIDQQKPYNLYLSTNAGATSGGYSPGDGKNIDVQEYKKNGCEKLAQEGYKCYVHKVSELNGVGFDYNKVGGLKFYISGKNGDETNDVEIPLHSEEQIGNLKLHYNLCMENIYVFFYNTQNAPLMLFYNNKWFVPLNRDEYFDIWKEEKSLDNAKPCQSTFNRIKIHLDLTNKNLNRIDLRKSSDYGIPTDKPLPPKQPDIDVNRVQVTKINGTDNRPYCKLVHRTINSFTIGDIYYDGSDIKNGVKINGQGNITVESSGTKNHTQFVNTNNTTNTVVAYYHKDDSNHTLPQLIVLLHTDKPIEDGQTINSSSSNKYGYYIINHSDDHCIYFEYEWRQPDHTGTQLKLDDETELSLLNSVVILVERKPENGVTSEKNGKYGDGEISKLVSALIKSKLINQSPGLNNDINRLKNKEVTLKEETCDPPDTCLKGTGFRAISHDINSIVDPKIKGAQDVTLIASLRFMIPTPKGEGEYTLLSLHESVERQEKIFLFHQKDKNCVYVYIYDKDPRPLLLCYNNKGYRAWNMEYYHKHKWYKDPSIDNCACDKTNQEHLLEGLVRVSNFLNPVDILERPKCLNEKNYTIHRFNGKDITIQVSASKSKHPFCYHKYTHIHFGIGNSPESGKGFRLGNIEYNNQCTQDESKSCVCIASVLDEPLNKYTPASEVVVYYYKGDPNHLNPLLVVLCNNRTGASTTPKYQPYYELQRSSTPTVKRYKKEERQIRLDDRTKSELETILDRILFSISKSLLINLSFRATTKVQYHGEYGEKKIIIEHDKYQAKVYQNVSEGKYVRRSETIDVKVSDPTDIKTSSGDKTGYQCYRHRITGIKNVDEFGGLRLFLWDNRSSEEDNDCKVTEPTNDIKKQCCEIDLYGDGSQPNSGSSTNCKIDPIAYTTCKGDLYVYFYGSDPRPLLLCYNGQAYKPERMEVYITVLR